MQRLDLSEYCQAAVTEAMARVASETAQVNASRRRSKLFIAVYSELDGVDERVG